MVTYIVLGCFTDQGLSVVRDMTRRSETMQEMAKRVGVEIKDIYWTLGQYDVVAVCNAPDDESMTAFDLVLGSVGHVRTQTLRAFSREAMEDILHKMR